MINVLKKFNSEIWVKVFTFLFLLSLFFPIRHVFLTASSYLTGDYSDFTSFSLYLSDILLFFAFLFILWFNFTLFWSRIKDKRLWILIFWLILALFFAKNSISGLNIWNFIKFLEFIIVAYGTAYLAFSKFDLKTWFFKIFAWFCGIQSIIALAQFAKQSSLGLYRLGESHLAPNMLGVAKIVSNGTTFIRGYGTFPHPNVFSAFLVTGVLIAAYLLMISNQKKAKIAYSFLIFLNILGLTVAFSRGAYLALGVGLVIFFGTMKYRKLEIARGPSVSEGSETISSTNQIASPRLSSGLAISVLAMSILISFAIFRPFLLTRATFSDQSTIDRKFYDQMGLKMAEQHPLFGVGAGENLLHMEQVSNKTLMPWEKQPPHNYFIIAAAELGIPFALILLWIFLYQLKAIYYKFKDDFSIYLLLLISLFTCFLVLMQFDHYFYTLQQTQMLLWILLGLIAAETNQKNSSPFKGEAR